MYGILLQDTIKIYFKLAEGNVSSIICDATNKGAATKAVEKFLLTPHDL